MSIGPPAKMIWRWQPDTREPVVAGTPFIVPHGIVRAEVQIVAVMHAVRRWPDS